MYLMLSADSYISLYKVEKYILDNFDQLLEEFFKTKTTNIYDETLFVKFLKTKLGEDSIKFEKVIGSSYNIPAEYKNIKWFNF